jgi:hypothetical protein
VAKKRELEISIAPDGTVQVHVSGFPGKQCLKVKQLLEEVVGPLQSQRLTSEYYEPETETHISLDKR